MNKRKFLIKSVCVAVTLAFSACSDGAPSVFASSPASDRAPQTGTKNGYYKIGNPYQIGGVTYYPKEDYAYKEIGTASWYGSDFHNGMTANGETYDMHSLTAAHRTLPLPSIVRVTNLQNGRSLVLRVNDRGPFVNDRIIDVSMAAAQLLDFKDKGTTQVQVEILPEESRALRDELLGKKTENKPAPASNDEPSAPKQLTVMPASDVRQTAMATAPLVVQNAADKKPVQTYNTWDADLPKAQAQKVVVEEQKPVKQAVAKQPVAVKKTVSVKKAAVPVAVVAVSDVAPGYYVQVGAFSTEENARKMAGKVSSFGSPVISTVDVRGKTLYRVRIPAENAERAVAVLDSVTAEGISGARLVEEKRAVSRPVRAPSVNEF